MTDPLKNLRGRKAARDREGHEEIEAEIRETAQGIAGVIGSTLPTGYGFALLVFGMGGHPGRMNYISNASREDMIVAFKELIARMEGRMPQAPEGMQ